MNFLFLIIFSLFTLFGCGNEENPIPMVSGTSPQKTNPITDNKWCSVEALGFEATVIQRYDFKSRAGAQNFIEYSRILFGNETTPYSTFPSTWRSSYSDWVEGSDYQFKNTVDIVSIGDLGAHHDALITQRALFDERVKGNNLFTAKDYFEPNVALSLKISKNREIVLFPCSSFSQDFTLDKNLRPEIEFKVFVGQMGAVRAARTENYRKFLEENFFKGEIDPYQISEEELVSNSWCNWMDLEKEGNGYDDPVVLSSLSFSSEEMTFGSNFIYPLGDFYTREKQIDIIRREVGKQGIYKYSINGSGIEIEESSNFINNYLSVIDSNGKVALIHNKINKRIVYSSDIYHRCEEANSKEYFEEMELYQDLIINLQKQKLGLFP